MAGINTEKADATGFMGTMPSSQDETLPANSTDKRETAVILIIGTHIKDRGKIAKVLLLKSKVHIFLFFGLTLPPAVVKVSVVVQSFCLDLSDALPGQCQDGVIDGGHFHG